MDKQALLDAIKQQIVKDNIGAELAKAAHHMVFGHGNPDADIVFIGEAPGKNEDLQGLPFVGAAGKFLDEMLAGIGLKREDIYITNIVKYRPPNNRDPLPEEKREFLPYLQAQLEVIQPKLVVTLGRHSTNCFLPDLQISKIHGQPKRVRLALRSDKTKVLVPHPAYPDGPNAPEPASDSSAVTAPDARYATATAKLSATTSGMSSSHQGKRDGVLEVVILPLFHPAAALYNGGMRSTLIEDFSAIPIIIEKLQ